MKATIKSVKRSATFDTSYIVVVYFRKGTTVKGGGLVGRLASGSLDGSLYSKSYDLAEVFPNTEIEGDDYSPADYYKTKNGKTSFNADKAFDDFESDFVGLEVDGLRLWDIPMSEASEYECLWVQQEDGTYNEWKVIHRAESEDVTREQVVNNCKRMIRQLLDRDDDRLLTEKPTD